MILLVNLSSESGATIVQTARDADVKVVDYDRLTAAGPGADVYVSFDNVAVGQAMADTVGPVIDELGVDKPKIVMMNGGPTDNNSKLFKEGYNESGDFAVSKKVDAGEWEVVADQDVPDWDNQQALTLFEQILVAQNNAVDAVFAANDGIAGAVVSALKSAGQDPVPLSGQDATASGIQNVLAGWQTMSVYKPIKAEAAAAAQAALALLNGEDVTALSGRLEAADDQQRRGGPALHRADADPRHEGQRRRHGDRRRLPHVGGDLHGRVRAVLPGGSLIEPHGRGCSTRPRPASPDR